MQGWIKLHRKILDSPIWDDPHYLKLWMYCLMKATHKKRNVLLGNNLIKLDTGQFITGRKVLSDELNQGMNSQQMLSEKTWYRYLETLEKLEMLTIKKTNKYSVVSIVKWHEYQEVDQQMTNKSPADDQQMTTNKNVKNVKNDKKKDYTSKIKDLLILFSPIKNFSELNKKYWDVIRETRKTGKVAESVIYNNMNKWTKYDLSVVEYALKSHIDNHKGKREEYTLGIMRNTKKGEISKKNQPRRVARF